MTPWQLASLASLAAVLCVAIATDLRSRRIPNALVLAGMATGFVMQTVAPEGDGLFSRWWGSLGPLQALYGLLAGLGMFLPFYMLRTLGAGDVKLLAMLGLWFGARPMLGVAVFTMLSGGVLALCVAVWTRSLRQVLANIREMVFGTLVSATALHSPSVPAPRKTTGRLPYALAIAAGAAFEIVLLKGWYR
jgi:prepilin peptidase CpaA